MTIIDPVAVHRVWAERILREDPLPSIEMRLWYMGINIPGRPGWEGPLNPFGDFARLLLYGPWDQVVRRREEAKRERIQLMSWLQFFWPDRPLELRYLKGFD